MADVTVYSTPTCPWCDKAKDYLAKKGVKFKSIDVSSDPIGRDEMVEKSHQLGVPVIDIDGEILVGFNRSELERVLGLTK